MDFQTAGISLGASFTTRPLFFNSTHSFHGRHYKFSTVQTHESSSFNSDIDSGIALVLIYNLLTAATYS
jgi:hypothetical protein